MKILIVSATYQEIFPVFEKLKFVRKDSEFLSSFTFNKIKTDVLITGIGIPYTMFYLSSVLSESKYDLVINAGIAGSFKNRLTLGTVVNVVEDQFSDWGIEDKDNFYTVFEKKLILPDSCPFVKGKLINKSDPVIIRNLRKLPKAKGLTVNTVSGNKKTIKILSDKFDSDIETMEGAAIFFVCLLKNLPFLCLRSISNKVEIRDKSKWVIPKAIENLNVELIKILEQL